MSIRPVSAVLHSSQLLKIILSVTKDMRQSHDHPRPHLWLHPEHVHPDMTQCVRNQLIGSVNAVSLFTWHVKAWFIGEMMETDRGMDRTLWPLQHIISVALMHLSLLLNQPSWSVGALCMITTPYAEINTPVLEHIGHTQHVLELWLFQSYLKG